MKTLHLNLKRKWFDMILSGEKKEEYRDRTQYWEKRLIKRYSTIGWPYTTVGFNWIDAIIFSNGYAKNRDQFTIEFKGAVIREGKEEWGAEKGKKYFVLKLGDVIHTNTGVTDPSLPPGKVLNPENTSSYVPGYPPGKVGK